MQAKPQIIQKDGLVIDDHWILIKPVDDINGRIGLKPFKESVYAS